MLSATKGLPWLAFGLLAVLVVSHVAPAWAQDLVPIGDWALDDGQSSPFTLTAIDSSASANNGTLMNFPSQPTWGVGAYDGALRFDGIDDRVDMGDPASLDLTGAMSMSFWMGRLGANAQAYAPLVGKNFSGGSVNDGYYVNSMTNSQIVFGITPAIGDAAVTLGSNALVPNGTWHHVVTTFDPGNRMAIYIDGVLDNELTVGVPTEIRSVTSPFTLGNLGAGSSTNAYSFKGYLDEVKVFNGVLGLPQIQSLAEPPPGSAGDPTPAVLVSHWKLDDGQADPNTTTAVDTTPSASNGILTNFDSPASWDTGKIDGALTFDGANDRVEMDMSAELDITGDLSMAFWLKPNGSGAAKYGALAGKNMSGGQESDGFFTDIVYTRSVNNETVAAGTIEFAITSDGANHVVRSNTAISLTDDTWHHVAVVYDDGSRMAIYIDGVLNGELTINVPEACDSPFTTPFCLGNLYPEDLLNPPIYGYKGVMDDVRVYTGVLTAAEIAELAGIGTTPGDANNDGHVDEQDAKALAANWGTTVATWSMGDFNGDKVVNAIDASILAANWGYGSGEAASMVPEPSTLILLVGGLFGLLMRRQSSRRG